MSGGLGGSGLGGGLGGGNNNSVHGTWLPPAGEELVVALRRLHGILSRRRQLHQQSSYSSLSSFSSLSSPSVQPPSVALLFHERMVHSQRLLTEAQSLHYQQILSVYLLILFLISILLLFVPID